MAGLRRLRQPGRDRPHPLAESVIDDRLTAERLPRRLGRGSLRGRVSSQNTPAPAIDTLLRDGLGQVAPDRPGLEYVFIAER
jgi:hypothetical protein